MYSTLYYKLKPEALPPPLLEIYRVKKFYAISPMFCYIFSLTHHFLSYFLSSATPLENKK